MFTTIKINKSTRDKSDLPSQPETS